MRGVKDQRGYQIRRALERTFHRNSTEFLSVAVEQPLNSMPDGA